MLKQEAIIIYTTLTNSLSVLLYKNRMLSDVLNLSSLLSVSRL